MLTRRSLLRAAAAVPLTALSSGPVFAASPEVFAEDDLAIRGTDPVAYFRQDAPVAGSPDFPLVWRGATWRFASAANLDAFMMNPEAYAPQYGGYCAYAAARGYAAPTVPEAWTIYDGKLYLNASLRVRRLWERDIPGEIARADANWPALLG